jgi:hypothetical protein
MDARVRRLRHESDGRPGGRYSAAAQAAAASFTREGLAAGRALTELARELRVSTGSLRRWLARHQRSFRPVEVSERVSTTTPVPSGSVVHLAGGHRIEGLDLPGVIAVVRALEARG